MKSAYYMTFTTWLCTTWWAFTLGHWILGTFALAYAVQALWQCHQITPRGV
jgi:hypothetical protein